MGEKREHNRIPLAIAPAPQEPVLPVLEERAAGRDCKNCAYFGVLNKHVGICRLNPPTPYGVLVTRQDGTPQWMTQSVWPSAIEGQWCGQFKPALDG